MNPSKVFISAVLLLICLLLRQASAEEMLSWQDCVKEAARNHPDLISAQEVVKESQAGKTITASTLFPQVDSTLNASTSKTTTKDSGGDKKSTTQDTYTYGANASQLLFDGFKTVNKVNAASENIKAAQYSYRFTSSTVRFRLRSAFISLLKAQESLNITEQIRKLRRDDLELITLRYESGIEHKGALLTAQANLAEADFEMTQTKRSVEVAQRNLIKEMGRTQFSPLRAAGTFDVTDAVLEKPDFDTLAKNNPSLGKLIAQKNAAVFGIKSAQADFLPTLSAQGAGNRTGNHWPPRDNGWDAGLVVNLPIFEGGLRVAQVAQARALYRQAEADERSTRDGIVLGLEQTWSSLQDFVEAVGVQKKFLTAAEERANIAEEQYSLGLIQFDNWIIIEDDLVSAKKAFLNTQANALLAEASWIQAKGEMLEYAQ